MPLTVSVDDAIAVVGKLEALSLKTEVDSKDTLQMPQDNSFGTPLKNQVRFVYLWNCIYLIFYYYTVSATESYSAECAYTKEVQ